MNLKKLCYLTTIVGGIGFFWQPQLTYAIEYKQDWIKSFGGVEQEQFEHIQKTSDGGFIVSGNHHSQHINIINARFSDALLIKYDKEGEEEWIASWEEVGTQGFRSVIETKDKGFVAVGHHYPSFGSKGHAVIKKYNSVGQEVWTNILQEAESSDYLNDVVELSNGDLIAVGKATIRKFDSEGNLVWKKSLTENGTTTFGGVVATSDDGFIVGGNSSSTDIGFSNQGEHDFVFVKYTGNGDVEWTKSLGGGQGDYLNDIERTKDGGFIIVGRTSSSELSPGATSGANGLDVVVAKYTEDGTQEWLTSWGGNATDFPCSITEDNQGNYIVTGYTESSDIEGIQNDNQQEVGFIISFDRNGQLNYQTSLKGDQTVQFNSVVQTANNDLFVVGFSDSTDIGFINQGGQDAIIVKYSPKIEADIQINGNIQPVIVDVTIPSVSPDLIIDPNSPDGVISPEFSIKNQSTSPIKLDLKTFEQTTSTFNDVLPDQYDSWVGLNKTQSQDIALGLVAKEGNGWQRLITPTSYVSGHIEHEIGVIKPTSQVNFEFEVHHGTAFGEAKIVQYKMVFVFDLLS